jgi:hypothetical protein
MLTTKEEQAERLRAQGVSVELDPDPAFVEWVHRETGHDRDEITSDFLWVYPPDDPDGEPMPLTDEANYILNCLNRKTGLNLPLSRLSLILRNPRGYLLTPVQRNTETRLSLRISDGDMAVIHAYGRRKGLKGTVTDLHSGKRYRIYGKSCEIPRCFCDAWAEEA